MKYRLANNTWGEEERKAILDTIDSGNLTCGERVEEYEKAFAEFTGSRYAVACNSGSSANLLMVAAFSIRRGSGTVIVPPLGWPTSYTPFLQYGWKLKFVDIDRETLNYDIQKLNAAYTGEELILAINILGNPNDFKHFPSMEILEDNCESLGAEYEEIKTGNFGFMSSHSTFFSHHVQTGEGGVVTTDDEWYYQCLLCLRSHGWTRGLPSPNLLSREGEGDFNFILPGFNVRPTEFQGAVGKVQLGRLPGFLDQRRRNAENFPLKKQKEIGKSSWYGFALFPENPDFCAALHERGIEYRPLLTRNFVKQPVIHQFDYTAALLEDADFLDKGIMIGNHPTEIDWSCLDGLSDLMSKK